ncbi:recombinase family protein [Thiospirillum jenense]|uniref:Recombinase family protein n=1 Tax=Thiospirillum jenense TaxID=1653858 RepID=A0A839HLT9_9GAMM|nr:recombinase family protein [Thiospirillum jenense]MBB1127367.1 recombinase family protein [Thiospirillum jenense]
MVYGYIRVSTDKQDYDNQKHGILEYCNRLKLSPVEFISETISSRVKLEERDVSRLIGSLKAGDVLVTSELSRLGRSILEVMTIFKELTEKGVVTHVIKGNFIINGTDNKIQSSVLIFAFGLSAEIERELISQRTKEALQRRKSEGVILGRKKGAIVKSKLDGKEEQIIDLVGKGVPVASIAKIFGCARGTLVNFISSRKIKAKD